MQTCYTVLACCQIHIMLEHPISFKRHAVKKVAAIQPSMARTMPNVGVPKTTNGCNLDHYVCEPSLNGCSHRKIHVPEVIGNISLQRSRGDVQIPNSYGSAAQVSDILMAEMRCVHKRRRNNNRSQSGIKNLNS